MMPSGVEECTAPVGATPTPRLYRTGPGIEVPVDFEKFYSWTKKTRASDIGAANSPLRAYYVPPLA